MTPSFEFTVAHGRPVTGFSLGDVSVTGTSGRTTSAGRTPSQSMMIFLSLVGLLDAVSAVLRAPQDAHVEFIGVDTSFRLVFERRSARVELLADGAVIDESDPVSLARSLVAAASAFRAQWRAELDGEAVDGDLDAAIADLDDLVSG